METYITARNGMRVPTRPIAVVGHSPRAGPPNWVCRECGLGFVRLAAAKRHRHVETVS